MLEQLAPPAQCRTSELPYLLNPELRSEMRLDLRYVLRDPARARALPLLVALNQTLEREPTRIRFPLGAVAKLADEIDSVADALPDRSPLIDLCIKARVCARAAAYERAEMSRASGAGPMIRQTVVEDLQPVPRSASEEAQLLKNAAAAIEVSYVTTAELGDSVLAGYLNYCMSLEKFDAVIASLVPRAAKSPRVWVWNLLLAAMRLSNHADFTETAARFHAWMEQQHPEAINDAPDRVDARRFSTQRLRILEQQELGVA